MTEIDISVDGVNVNTEPLQELLEQAIAALDMPDAILSVVLCTDDVIQPLNRDWRGKDAPTDVLSFAQYEGEGAVDSPVLGDLVVSVQTAQRQADELGHDLNTELAVLLVHGLCHLLGFDHETPEEADEMRLEEARLLEAVGASAPGLVRRAGA